MAKEADGIATLGLDLTDLQKQITVAVSELSKIKDAAESIDKVLKSAGDSSKKAAKDIGLLGQAMKFAIAYFAGSKIIQFGQDAFAAYQNTKQLRLELESVSAKRGGAFQTQGQLQSGIADAQAAIKKENERLGLSDITDPAKKWQSAWQQALLDVGDRFRILGDIIEKGGVGFVGRKIDVSNSDDRQKAAKAQALQELAKLQNQLYLKQQEITKAGIKSEFEDSVQAQKDLIEIKRKEQIGQILTTETAAKAAQEKAINDQAKLETDSLDKQHDMLLANLDVRNTISQVIQVGYGLQQQSLDAQIEENNNLLASGKLNADEVKNLKAQTAEYVKQKNDSMAQYELEKKQSALQTEAMEAQIYGDQQNARLLQIRLQYEQQIAQAQREGKDAVAQQLKNQQALSELAARAAEHDKTPQQKRAELDENLRQRRSLRGEQQREKQFNKDEDARLNGVGGRRGDPLSSIPESDDFKGLGGHLNLFPEKKKRDYKTPGQLGKDTSQGALNVSTLTITGGITTSAITTTAIQPAN